MSTCAPWMCNCLEELWNALYELDYGKLDIKYRCTKPNNHRTLAIKSRANTTCVKKIEKEKGLHLDQYDWGFCSFIVYKWRPPLCSTFYKMERKYPSDFYSFSFRRWNQLPVTLSFDQWYCEEYFNQKDITQIHQIQYSILYMFNTRPPINSFSSL